MWLYGYEPFLVIHHLVMFDDHWSSGIRDITYLLCCNHSPSLEDFSILTRENNDFKLKIMKSLLIGCDELVHNKAVSLLRFVAFQAILI